MFLRPGFVVVIVGATLTSVSTAIVALRYYCRHFLMRSMGWSDHLMFIALVFTWGSFVVNFYQDDTSRRFRPNFFRRPEKRPQMKMYLRGSLIAWWVYRMIYNVALCFVKLSILFFYRAIAPHRTFRRIVYATMAVVSLYTIASVFASIFQCEHPEDAWSTEGYLAQFNGGNKNNGGSGGNHGGNNGTNNMNKRKERPHKCFDPIRLWVFSAAVNLLSDVVILLLPIPALLSLRVPMSKRLALIGIFSVGIMAIVASSVRLWVMMLWAQSPTNSARFGANLLLWGQVEINAGIISASVPFLRTLFQRRRKEERGVTERKIEMSPPKPMGGEKPPAVDTWALYEMEHEKELERGGERSPGWQPFITVPESLCSGSRGSMRPEPTREPHSTM